MYFGYNDLTGWSFAGQVLSGTYFEYVDLTGADFTGAEIREAYFFLATGFTAAQLYSTASYQAAELSGTTFYRMDLSGWNFVGQNLTDASFQNATLTRADFTSAEIRGASFSSTTDTGFTAEQLYSTASYQAGDLTRVYFGYNDLTGWSFAGQNLTGAGFRYSTLTGADFTGAEIRGAGFYSTTDSGFTAAQLYSTASHQAGNLSGIVLDSNDLTGWDFAGQNLADASFQYATLTGANLRGANLTNADFQYADLTGADLSGSDSRGWWPIYVPPTAPKRNFIHFNGYIEGLHITTAEVMRFWDLDPTSLSRYTYAPLGDIPILVGDGMSIDPAGTLRVVFEDDQWGSTITFEPGIPVTLDGTLELLFDDDANPMSLVGTTYQLFDWTGVSPEGQFEYILTAERLALEHGPPLHHRRGDADRRGARASDRGAAGTGLQSRATATNRNRQGARLTFDGF